MFGLVLNTPLSGNGRKNQSLKNISKFTLEISGKKLLLYSEECLEPSRTSTMRLFSENSQPLKDFIYFAKKSIVDVQLASKYISGINHQIHPFFRSSKILIYPLNVLCSHKKVEILKSFLSLISLISY